MNRQLVDGDQTKTDNGAHGGDRCCAEYGQVLVIDGVEFVVLDAGQGLRRFDNERSLRRQQRIDPAHEVVEVVDVVERVGGDDHLRLAVGLGDLLAGLLAEIGVDDVDAAGDGEGADIGRGIDAKRLDPFVVGRREQEPVVAADVDDVLVRRSDQFGLEALRQGAKMHGHRRRRGGNVKIIDVIILRKRVRNLDQSAVEADMGVERIGRLAGFELFRFAKRVGRRVIAEGQITVKIFTEARPAGCLSVHDFIPLGFQNCAAKSLKRSWM